MKIENFLNIYSHIHSRRKIVNLNMAISVIILPNIVTNINLGNKTMWTTFTVCCWVWRSL